MQQTVTTIRGETVLLRPLRESDLEESVRVWTPELRHMYGGSLTAPAAPVEARREGKRRLLERVRRGDEGHFFAIEIDGRYIGFVILGNIDEEHLSGSYRIGIENSECWGRGYGTEVARLMLRYAFRTLGLHRVRLRVAACNVRARRCYEKAGFRVEGLERHSFRVDGEWHDDLLMAALSDDWSEFPAAPASAADIRIRTYRTTDHEAVTSLWQEAGFTLRGNDSADALAHKLAVEQGPFLVADAAGEIVGTAMGHVDRRWGWINRVAVRPDHRRRGIARRLIAEVERQLLSLGAESISLLTHRDDAPAVSLYLSLGYEARDEIIYMVKRFEPAQKGDDCGA